jgi:flagellar protein FliO/FliZ
VTDYVLRLGLVLPLLLLALGGLLLAARRGLIRLPGVATGEAPLKLVQVVALGPGTKLAVAEFGGERLLIGIGRDGVRLLRSVP